MDILNLEKSKVKRDLLVLYFSHPEKRYYLRELERMLAYQVSYIRRELISLEKIGLFVSEYIGKERFFKLNKDFIFYKEVKTILDKTYGVEGFLRNVLSSDERIKQAYIFGSYAKNKLSSESDIDLLLVSQGDIKRTKTKIYDFQEKIKREINIVDFNEKEFSQRKRSKEEFVFNILNNPKIKLL